MEELSLTTPSLLFSAVSLILLAYTNRFLAYASVVRGLKAQHQENPSMVTYRQIQNLKKRLYLTRAMQILGIGSLLLCVLCMFFIFVGWYRISVYIFGTALLLLSASLMVCIQEIRISVDALDHHLRDMEDPCDPKNRE